MYKTGILIHLATILPAGLLVDLQFTPAIRHQWTPIHRITGYVVITLYIISLAGASMIARYAFGGGFEVQAFLWVGGLGILISLLLVYINIKRLQIEEHRAWMLRAWFYVL